MTRKLTFLILALFALIAGPGWGQARENLELTFDLSSNPGDWPTTNSTTLTDYTYTLDDVDYTFALKNVKCNSGYLMLTQPAALGLPALESYKLTKVVAKNTNGCSTSVYVGISSSASEANYIEGGAAQKWATQGSSYTYNLSGTNANTMYYMYVTSKNAQVTELALTYEPATPSTNFTVTYDANDATSGTVPVDENEYESGASVTVLGNTDLAKTGHTFDGWNTKADGTGTDHAAGSTFEITANTTLYAKWQVNTHTVTLPAEDQYGTYAMNTGNPVAFGTEVTLSYRPATGYENYTAKWSVNGTPLTSNTFTMPDENVNVTVTVAEDTSVTYDFTEIVGFSNWTNAYAEHVVQYTEATVTFTSASKQSTIIDNMPVTKGQPVTLVMEGGRTISSVRFDCKQWGEKQQTITLHYSINGGGDYTSTEITSSNFIIASNNLPEGTNAVMITFSSSGNQVGIQSATIDGIEVSTTYTVSINENIQNGTVTANHYEATAGQIITLTPNPNPGYAFSSWNVYKENDPNTTIIVTDNQFEMPNYNVVVSATFATRQPVDISSIESAGNYLVQGTVVAKSAKGFILADETGYVYVYLGEKPTQSINDMISVEGDVKVYSKVLEFSDDNLTIQSVESSTYTSDEPMAMTGSDMEDLLEEDINPSYYMTYAGTLSIDGSRYTITLSDSQEVCGSISYPTNTDELAALDGKSVTISGYYVGISTSNNIKYINTMLVSIEEAELPTYTIVLSSNGVDSDDIEVQGSYELPDPTNVPTGFSFAGWTESESNIQFVANPYTPTRDVTLFAVFSRVEGGIAGSGNYEKVTSALTDWRGDYLIAYNNDVFMNGSLAGGTDGVGAANSSVAPGTALTDNTISAAWGDQYYVTIEAINDNDLSEGYVIKSHSEMTPYFYQTQNKNGMAATDKKSTAANYPIRVEFDTENNIDIALGGNAEGAVLHYNNTDTGKMFRFYKDGGQSPVYLYKKAAGTPGTTHYYTRVYDANTTIDDALTVQGPSIILSDYTLTVTGAMSNENPANLVIEDGAQLFQNSSNVMATFQKNITGYTGDNDNYYLIANPTNNDVVANLTDNDYDLYSFDPCGDEDGYEWINEEGEEVYVKPYSNEDGSAVAVGYLYANREDVTLEFAGVLNPAGSTDIELTYAEEGEGRDFPGFNLIGNPYACDAYLNKPAYVLNGNGDDFESIEAGTPIAPCEGFFVEATPEGQSVTVSTAAPVTAPNALSLNVSQNRGNVIDRAIVNFNGSNNLHKFMMNPAHTNLSIAKGGETFAAISTEAEGELPVNFKAEKNGTYTITVNTKNVDAEYLHLIDNMTGMDVDLLSTPSYTFEAKTSDYASRFKLVFGVNNTASESSDSNFAFMSDGNLVIDNIDGEATLQIVDMLGRVISTETVSGSYNKALNLKAGLYILNLNGMTQKIVVE